MPPFLFSILPGLMAKYEYALDLLSWLKEWHGKLKAHEKTFDYPTIEPLLLSSLEKVAQDLGSVPLLKFLLKLKEKNDRLTALDWKNDGDVIENYFSLQDEVPELEKELRRKMWAFRIWWGAFSAALWILVLGALMLFVRNG